MRQRLTIVLVLLVAGTLLVAGVGTLLVARRAAREDAVNQLVKEAGTFAAAARTVQGARVLRVVDDVLRPEGGRILVITPGGAFGTSPGIAGISAAALAAGHAVTGWRGATVYAAVPAQLSSRLTARLPPGTHLAVLLTRQVGTFGPGWTYIVLVSGVTLLIAAAVAAWLAERITHPLVEASAVTGRIAGGELTARVVPARGDYPELVRMGESINSMAEGLEGARERERQLLLSVSHDLRTPLTSIRGYAEAIEEGIASDVEGAARVIVNESKRLERLVADLLDLARLGASQLSLHIGPTDVIAVAATEAEAFRPRAEAAGVDVVASLPGPGNPILLVAADPDRLAQVVGNLVENSITFARTRVKLSVQPPGAGDHFGDGGSVLLLVEDDGPGIAPGDLERVFDRFYRADRQDTGRGGLGLGLSIVAELVRAMGGRTRAESPISAEGGTRMVVELRPWSTSP